MFEIELGCPHSQLLARHNLFHRPAKTWVIKQPVKCWLHIIDRLHHPQPIQFRCVLKLHGDVIQIDKTIAI